MNNNLKFTVLSTKKALIGNKYKVVETLKEKSGRQNIQYKVNGQLLDSEIFWAMNPIFQN